MNIPRERSVQMVVALAVAVVNAAGPWLCWLCCASFACTATPPVERPAETRPACSHCCQDDSETPPPTDREPCKECPMRERLAAAADALPVTPEAAQAPAVAPAVNPLAELPPDPAGRLVDTVDQFVCDLPFMPTQVRLRAHHAMRC